MQINIGKQTFQSRTEVVVWTRWEHQTQETSTNYNKNQWRSRQSEKRKTAVINVAAILATDESEECN